MKVHWPPTPLKVLYYTIFTSDPEEPYLSFHPENPELSEDLKETLPSEILGTTNPFVTSWSLPEQPSELERISKFLKSLGPKSKRLLDDATTGTPAIFKSLGWDQENGGGLVASIDINGLDEDKMQSKLRKLREEVRTGKRKYHLFASNCSTLSAEVLLAGAGSDKFDLYKSMNQISREINTSRQSWILPGNSQNKERILEYVRDAAESVLFQYHSRGGSSGFVVKTVSRDTLCLTIGAETLARRYISLAYHQIPRRALVVQSQHLFQRLSLPSLLLQMF
jgi:hypothetical protein